MAVSDRIGGEVFDSRDVIERLEEMREGEVIDGYSRIPEGYQELLTLGEWGEENVVDWQFGETLIREDYFVQYIEELIADCYPPMQPKEMDASDWPYRHFIYDYEAAAEEAKQDYMTVEFQGATYYVRG